MSLWKVAQTGNLSPRPTVTRDKPRHFLDLSDFDQATLRQMLDWGVAYKAGRLPAGKAPLAGKRLAMVFEKPSTRTRVSFEVAMQDLGGQVTHSEPGRVPTRPRRDHRRYRPRAVALCRRHHAAHREREAS